MMNSEWTRMMNGTATGSDPQARRLVRHGMVARLDQAAAGPADSQLVSWPLSGLEWYHATDMSQDECRWHMPDVVLCRPWKRCLHKTNSWPCRIASQSTRSCSNRPPSYEARRVVTECYHISDDDDDAYKVTRGLLAALPHCYMIIRGTLSTILALLQCKNL